MPVERRNLGGLVLVAGIVALAPDVAWAASNRAPVAPALPAEVSYREGDLVELRFPAFVDPEGTAVTYSFSGLPRGVYGSGDADGVLIYGELHYIIASRGKTTVQKATIKARDATGKQTKRTIKFRIADYDPPPRHNSAVSVPSIEAEVGLPFLLSFAPNVFTDIGPLVYSARGMPGWLAFEPAGWRFQGTPTAGDVGFGGFELCATDLAGQTTCVPTSWTVRPANRAPIVAASAPTELTVVEDDPYFVIYATTSLFSDPDGDLLNFALEDGPAWLAPYLTNWFRGAPATDAETGDFAVTVVANDGRGGVARWTFVLHALPRNDPPQVQGAFRDLIAAVDAPFAFTIPDGMFSDEEGTPLAIDAIGLPGWLAFDPATRTVSGIAGRLDRGLHPLTVTVIDGGGAAISVPLRVRVPDENAGPIVVAPLGTQRIALGAALDLDASGVFADPEGDPLELEAEGLPAWASFDALARRFSGTPDALTVKPHTVWLGATDAAGESKWIEFDIEVVPAASGVTVSGRIVAQADAAMDWDVNDGDAPYRSNRYQADAQRIFGTHAVVGGFLASDPTGVPGATFAEVPDLYDVYRVQLAAGQSVSVAISDAADDYDPQHDIDVYLFDPNFGLVDASYHLDPIEVVTALEAGEYLVVLDGFRGANNYLMTVDAPPVAGAAVAKPRLTTREVVPGQAVVRLARSGPMAKARDVEQVGAALGARTVAGGAGRSLLLELDLGRARAAAAKRQAPEQVDWRALALDHPRHGATVATVLEVKRLAAQPGVAHAAPNGIVRATALPDDPLYPRQWDMPSIGMPFAWDITTGSPDVVVAVLDTGVIAAHPDLAPNLVAGFDFVSDPERARDGDGIDADPEDPGDAHELGWSSFHGTHVAGTVGARGDDGYGVAGTAWNVKLMPLRVLGLDGGTEFDLFEAIRYAAGLPNASGTLPTKRADVINMSLGGYYFDYYSEAVIQEVRDAGVVVIASAGNTSDASMHFPAAFEGVVSVAATDRRRERAYYSTHNWRVDVAAPGGDARFDRDGDGFRDGVLSCLADDASGLPTPSHEYYQGTSMAAPHVAGVVALMKSVHPGLTPLEFDSDLAAGLLTEDSGGDGAANRNDAYGYGIIDAPKAVLRARERAAQPLPAPLLVPEPSALAFGFAGDERLLTVRNGGTGAVALGAATTDQPWLAVAPFSIDAEGLGTYLVTLDRAGLPEGDHLGRISFAREGMGPLTVPVSVRVLGPSNPAPDNGRHYVVFADPVTLATVAAAPVEAVAGEYRFSVAGVPPGEWLLFAGSDRDGDGSICDAGEACGAYPTLEARGTVVVGGTDLEVGDLATAFHGEPSAGGLAPAMLKLAPGGVLKAPPR